jgi:2,4-dienoyl-CoA reductase (NADPH2)
MIDTRPALLSNFARPVVRHQLDSMQYERLFSPYRLGRLPLRNRIAVLPYGTAMVSEGVPSEADRAHFANIAKSGAGLVITGSIAVHPSTATRNRILTEAYNERALEKLRTKTDMLHAHGTVAFAQLAHLGREWPVGDSDVPPMAPSAVRSPRDAYLPRAMTELDIKMIVQAFGESSRNMRLAGFDGVEIHAAHGYLVAQFLSPDANKRSDAYGGTPAKRSRFLLEIIDAIRKHCGEDFGLSVRLSADEELADGLQVPDTARIAKSLEAHGGVSLLNITLGVRGSYVKDLTIPDAVAANAAIAIRRATSLPILVGQRISTPEVAERVLGEGAADLVGMARAFIADPEWVAKAASGRAKSIRPCLNFNQDCRAFSPHLHCAVNPVIGRESSEEFSQLLPTQRRKNVAIIGGGPGGLEAALVAAQRGHEVAVFEQTESFGGQFLYAASVPHRKRLSRLIDYQLNELRLLGVKLHTGVKIEGYQDLSGVYDTAIVATGARATALDQALSDAGAISWFDVLDKGAPPPSGNGRAVFIDDGCGFWWSYGVAEALAEAGWEITIATPSASVAHLIPHESVPPLLARLGAANAEYRVLTSLDSIDPAGARLVNLTSGQETLVPCGLVVIQTGRVSVPGPVSALKNGGIDDVHVVGDCITPRRVSFAIFEAHMAARTI